MGDKLEGILEHFSLRARVFQNGLLCRSSNFDGNNGLGYLHVLRAGSLKIKIPGEPEHNLNQPSLFFTINPIAHYLYPEKSGADLVCASFDFNQGINNPLTHALPKAILLNLNETPSLNASLQLLFFEAADTVTGQQALLDRLIEVIIIQLLRELIHKEHIQTGLLAGLSEPKLAKAIIAMHKEPATPWTLDSLAKVAGMSRARFASKFREIVGTTPGNYLIEWRIGVAQSLIRKGKSLESVAENTGYANASALSRAFSATVGVSPSKWKKHTDT